MADLAANLISFFRAQKEAEERGEHEFACPICGGEAAWNRSSYNNHLRCGCKKCGFLIMA